MGAEDPEVTVEYRSLAELARWPRNPKNHDLPSLKASMRRFGFVLPLVEDARTRQLVAGHGRLEALLGLQRDGEPAPARVRVGPDGGWSVPVVSGVSFADEHEAEAYLLADNHLVEVGGWDPEALSEILRSLESSTAATESDPGGLAGTGFNLSDFAALAPQPPADDPVEHWQGMPEFAQADERGAKTILVHFKTMEDYEAFKVTVGQPRMTPQTRMIWFPEAEIAHTMDEAYSDEPGQEP